ncbi:hypothetical protein ACV3S2_04070 [Clostridium perfringens]
MINKKLIKALKELNIPVLYATRGNKTTFPLVVFNFIESPEYYGNTESKLSEYELLLNVYVDKNQVFELVKKIEDLMRINKFIQLPKIGAKFDDTLNVFNQPLEFKILIDEEEIINEKNWI